MLTSFTAERLRKTFMTGFCVMDIAEPLVSFDSNHSPKEMLEIMGKNNFDVVGINHKGRVCGYVRVDELNNCKSDVMNQFNPDSVLADTASLSEVVMCVNTYERAFVSILGVVGAIVELEDLQKPPLRMWLFGMLTIFEMNLTYTLAQIYPNNTWQEAISAGRFTKTKEFQKERKRRKQNCKLIECLQFSDKLQILVNDPKRREILGYPSKKKAMQFVKRMEAFRNNLSHAQDFIDSDWLTIIDLVNNMDDLFQAKKLTLLIPEDS
jgi:hypothetical protein